MLSGTLNVTVGFDDYVLGPGDSIFFESTIPHRLHNDGAEDVRGDLGHARPLRPTSRRHDRVARERSVPLDSATSIA